MWVLTTISASHRPAGAKGDSARRRFKPSAPRSNDRGSKPPPTVPDRSREVKVHYGRAEFATFGGGGVDRRRRGGIQSRARPSPPAPRACSVAPRARLLIGTSGWGAVRPHAEASRSIPPASAPPHAFRRLDTLAVLGAAYGWAVRQGFFVNARELSRRSVASASTARFKLYVLHARELSEAAGLGLTLCEKRVLGSEGRQT